MSVLAPLYLLGLAAISLPLIFHLIRRSPRGEVRFSSVMFLSPSPPRLTRRSRLDNLLLLLLRGLALTLLALAFARPFLRQAALANLTDQGGQRVAILVDTSASMRRGDLWPQAARALAQAVDRCQLQDQYAVFAFDETLRPIAGYDELARIEPARRKAAVLARMKEISPSWAATHLGQSLADAVAAMGEIQDTETGVGPLPRRVILISDLQQGSRLQVLGEYEWPEDAHLELISLQPKETTNAGLKRLADSSPGQEADRGGREVRVRVSNADDSQEDLFRIQWQGPDGVAFDDPIDVYVPAGESRVTRIAPPSGSMEPRLLLTGDAHDFDNTLYFLPQGKTELSVVYLGDDAAADPAGMRYYLERALQSDATSDVHFVPCSPGDNAVVTTEDPPQLVVVTATPAQAQCDELRQYAGRGGTVLYVVTDPTDGPALAQLMDVAELDVLRGKVDGYTMFSEIAFDHPLFAVMAGPQFNDFTQIRFWKYRTLDLSSLADPKILASFENGDPAILEQGIGKGRAVVLATGWQPDDGQLARSWKFLLMLRALVEDDLSARAFHYDYRVNDRVVLPANMELTADLTITKPAGNSILLAREATTFADTDEPGIYIVHTSEGPARFVIHLDPQESDTAPLPVETFQQLGCRLTGEFDAAREQARIEQFRDVELEGRQKIWKWLVAVVVGVLIMETVLAGWVSRTVDTRLATA